MNEYYCSKCKGKIIPYKIKDYPILKVTYIYGTCACELEYDKYCNVISSPHKRIDITCYGTSIWDLKIINKKEVQ